MKSTPHYPQSNGHAESAVKAMKSLLIKTSPNGNLDKEEFQIGLLEFRNTPKAHGLSPAQVLFGHPLRSPVPAHHTTFAKSWRDMMHTCEQAAAKGKQKIEEQYNSHARALPPLKPGMSVRIQDPKSKLWDTCGTIISVGKNRDQRSSILEKQALHPTQHGHRKRGRGEGGSSSHNGQRSTSQTSPWTPSSSRQQACSRAFSS